jgi:hypothetical protein
MTSVENHNQDLSQWNSYSNSAGLKREDVDLPQHIIDRIKRDARDTFLDGFGIDWDQFGEPELSLYEGITAQLEWTRRRSGQKIMLTRIYWDDDTGEIVQAGTQYGELTL